MSPIFETVDLKDLQHHFGKQLPADIKKTIQRILKNTGWRNLNLLHVSSSAQGGGLAEMLFWWAEVYNCIAGEQGSARWEVPFCQQAFLEPLVLPSGQVVAPDEVLIRFLACVKKLNIALQHNTGQRRPLPVKLALVGNRLILIHAGLQTEIQDRNDLLGQLADYFQVPGLQSLAELTLEEVAARIITEDDLQLYQAVTKAAAAWLLARVPPSAYHIILLHNFAPLGLMPYLRPHFPRALFIWRNHLATADPTPVVWNFFAPLINQVQASMHHVLEYNPAGHPDLLPARVSVIIHSPSLYPLSPKNRELNGLGLPAVRRILAQYDRDHILIFQAELKRKVERAFLKLTGARISDSQLESILDSLTRASIRAAFIEDGRRPEIGQLVVRAAESQDGLLALIRQVHGIGPERPLFVQVSRYDPLKDPVGTTAAFARAYLRLVRENLPLAEIPQFVYAGTLDDQDPLVFEELVKTFNYLDSLRTEIEEEITDRTQEEREEIYRQLRRDIFVLILPAQDRVAHALEINALQRTSRAVVQKSLREGFGLAVTEAMWKGVPVIGSNTGGIRIQIDHGINGFLAGQLQDGELHDSVEDTAQYMITYAKHPDVAARMGEMGRRKVAKDFLMPINLDLFMKKIGDLVIQLGISAKPENTEPAAAEGATGPADPESELA